MKSREFRQPFSCPFCDTQVRAGDTCTGCGVAMPADTLQARRKPWGRGFDPTGRGRLNPDPGIEGAIRRQEDHG